MGLMAAPVFLQRLCHWLPNTDLIQLPADSWRNGWVAGLIQWAGGAAVGGLSGGGKGALSGGGVGAADAAGGAASAIPAAPSGQSWIVSGHLIRHDPLITLRIVLSSVAR